MEPVISLQRIAAARHEIDDPLERLPVEIRIGRRPHDLVMQRRKIEPVAAGPAHDMLRQHVERALPQALAVYLARLDRRFCRPAFEHLEPVRRHQHRPARLVHAVVRPPDPLDQPGRALGCAHLDHEVHLTPVNAEIERRGADHRLQLARRHRRFHPHTLVLGQRAMVQRDRQVVVIHPP